MSLPNHPLFDAVQDSLDAGRTADTMQLPIVPTVELVSDVAPRLRPMTLPDGSWLLVLDGAPHLAPAELDEIERVLLAHTAAAGLLVFADRVEIESCCVPATPGPGAGLELVSA